ILAVIALNSIGLSAIVAGIAWLWFRSIPIAAIIGSALIINLLIAALAGCTVPLLLRRLGIDPALAGPVVLTTFTDVMGFLVFLGLGTLYLLCAGLRRPQGSSRRSMLPASPLRRPACDLWTASSYAVALSGGPGGSMKKVVVLNTKGGCGKTTITTNLAAYHAAAGYRTTLMDYDPQGSSTRWLSKRDESRPRVNGVAAFERNTRVTRSFQLRAPLDTEYLFVDTPAGLDPHSLTEITRNAHAVIVPVLPSDIDIHAASR